MTYIFDASYGHASITPAAMTKAGADGVILYAGCNDGRKNATKAEIHALLNAGFQVGLVIENFAADAIKGAPVGTAQGKAIVAAAKLLDYDWQNCVLFGGYDTDAHAGDYASLLAYMEAFAAVVPVPGYYGDSDSIDFLQARHPGRIYWQSDSRAFSPLNPTPNAHLLQLYNDPRAHGLPVDVDLVERTPLRLMGQDMTLTDAERASLIADIADKVLGHTIWNTVGTTLAEATRDIRGDANAANSKADDIAAQVKSLAASVAALSAQVKSAGVDPAVLAGLLAQHLALVAK